RWRGIREPLDAVNCAPLAEEAVVSRNKGNKKAQRRTGMPVVPLFNKRLVTSILDAMGDEREYASLTEIVVGTLDMRSELRRAISDVGNSRPAASGLRSECGSPRRRSFFGHRAERRLAVRRNDRRCASGT